MNTFSAIGCLALVGLLCGCEPKDQSGIRSSVVYHVKGSVREARVKYALPPTRSPLYSRRRQPVRYVEATVPVPFTSEQYSFPIAGFIFLQASNTGPTGDLRVEIVTDGTLDPFWHMRAYTTNAYGIATAQGTIGLR